MRLNTLPSTRLQLFQGGNGSAGGQSSNGGQSGSGTGGGSGGGSGQWPDRSLADHFVAIEGGEFVLGCEKFPISGFNA